MKKKQKAERTEIVEKNKKPAKKAPVQAGALTEPETKKEIIKIVFRAKRGVAKFGFVPIT